MTILPSKVHPALRVYFGYCLNRAALRLRTIFSQKIEKYNLIPPQYGIMCLLNHSGSLSQNQIGDFVGIDKATMVKLIDGLENRGLAKRISSKMDRRTKKIELTPKGLELLQTLQKIHRKVEKDFLKPLSKSEQKTLHKITLKLLNQKP